MILEELKTILSPIIPVETGVFSNTAPEQYAVLTPLSDEFALHADDRPGCDVQAVRVSLYDKGNYIKIKNTLVSLLLSADMTITGRRYIGHEEDTGYHHYAIDVAKTYQTEE